MAKLVDEHFQLYNFSNQHSLSFEDYQWISFFDQFVSWHDFFVNFPSIILTLQVQISMVQVRESSKNYNDFCLSLLE